MARKQIQTTLKVSPSPASYTAIPCGFDWGALRVTRRASHKGYVVLGLDVGGYPGHRLDVTVSPTGKSITIKDWNTGIVIFSTARKKEAAK